MTPEIELTDREYQILRDLAGGLTAEQIAKRLHFHRSTIHRVSVEVMGKLGAQSLPHAVDRAWRLGILGRDEPMLPQEKPLPPVTYDPQEVIRRRREVLNDALRGYRRRQGGEQIGRAHV